MKIFSGTMTETITIEKNQKLWNYTLKLEMSMKSF